MKNALDFYFKLYNRDLSALKAFFTSTRLKSVNVIISVKKIFWLRRQSKKYLERKFFIEKEIFQPASP